MVSGAGSKTGPVPATVFCILCVLVALAPTLKWDLYPRHPLSGLGRRPGIDPRTNVCRPYSFGQVTPFPSEQTLKCEPLDPAHLLKERKLRSFNSVQHAGT